MDRTQFDIAVARAVEAAQAYYHSDTMVMSDAEYDALVASIAETAKLHPDWDTRGVVDEVAAGTGSAGADVRHPQPMLSLSKSTEPDELDAFVARVGNLPLVTEVKLDGLAVRVEYRRGALSLVATRGDGILGEDVTAQALRLRGLPVRLPEPLSIEVRGEVYMTDSDFTTASANRVAAGKQPFVNPRNATAGCLRNRDADYDAPMSFAAYDASGDTLDDVDSHVERMNRIKSLGVATALSLISLDELSAPSLAIADIAAKRDTLPFPIDGAVVKVDSMAARASLGEVSRHPRWAVAWKYPAAEASSVLRDIEVTIGRTGRLALTAIIDPVFVAGATVSRATLHNVDFVTSQGLGIGSRVAVIRAGDVIPRVTALLGEQPADVSPWTPPATCPNCDEAWDTSSVLWRCLSAECSASAALNYWASRDCMDIERLGEGVCDALVQAGLASNVADLYDLTIETLAELPMGETATGGIRRLGEANAREIVLGLDRSKSQPLNRVITGLGIRLTGRSVGRWLAREFPTMDRLRAATVEEIAAIDKLGPIKAQSIVTGLKRLAPIIDRLAAAGVNMGTESSSSGNLPLEGKTYVVSGAVPGYTRTTIAEKIESLGGKSSSSVSKATTALVSAETETSKAKKAAQLGIPVISPEEFVLLLGD